MLQVIRIARIRPNRDVKPTRFAALMPYIVDVTAFNANTKIQKAT